MMSIALIYLSWGLGEDIYDAFNPEVEVVAEATASLSMIEPIKVTAEYRKPYEMSDQAFEKYKKTSAWEKYLERGRILNEKAVIKKKL
ncbi:hypothetical protein HOD02_01200 [bacterium]|nr:hypothetical protein [bacterium]